MIATLWMSPYPVVFILHMNHYCVFLWRRKKFFFFFLAVPGLKRVMVPPLRRWPNISPTLCQCLVFVGYILVVISTLVRYTSSQHSKTRLVMIDFKPLHRRGGGPRVVVGTAAFHARVRGSIPVERNKICFFFIHV